MSDVLRRTKALIVPCLVGLLLSAALAGACFLLEMGLRRPSPAERLTAQMVGQLERIGSTRAVEVLRGVGSLKSTCIAHPRVDQLRISTGIRYAVVGVTAKVVSEPEKPAPYAAAQADLAACPRLIEDELSGRLHSGPPVRLYATRYSRVRAYMLRINNGRPVVRMLVQRRTLAPLGLEFIGKHVYGFSRIVAVTLRHKHRPRRGGDVFLTAPSPSP
jgi:hypothetical protein